MRASQLSWLGSVHPLAILIVDGAIAVIVEAS